MAPTETQSTRVIAEIGVNHDGDLSKALHMIDECKRVGFDTVKFQLFNADLLAAEKAKPAGYQKMAGYKNQREMLKSLEISRSDVINLQSRASANNIDFLVTPFDDESLKFLVSEAGLREIKIGSGDLTNGPLLFLAGQLGVDIILSTGMSTFTEIRHSLACVFLGKAGIRSDEMSFELVNATEVGPMLESLSAQVTILHCVSCYPCPDDQTNLKRISEIMGFFPGLKVGFSDHTLGVEAAVASVAMGASVIEKHVTFDVLASGPDHSASLQLAEAQGFLESIRRVEKMMQNQGRNDCQSEVSRIARKSLHVAREAKLGEKVDLYATRPSDGVSPFYFWDYEQSAAVRDFSAGELFEAD